MATSGVSGWPEGTKHWRLKKLFITRVPGGHWEVSGWGRGVGGRTLVGALLRHQRFLAEGHRGGWGLPYLPWFLAPLGRLWGLLYRHEARWLHRRGRHQWRARNVLGSDEHLVCDWCGARAQSRSSAAGAGLRLPRP